ncbi:reverse transcriptase domain-containing protein [Tanacetum coccineum]
MRTRSQTRNCNRQQQSQQAVVQLFHLEEPFVNPPVVQMADNRTMAQLLQAPTEGYEDAIVIPEINANFELSQGVSKTDFENYLKANDAVLRNMQNQGQGTLPSQTVTNPREHVNAITTRSGKTCEGPSTPLIPTSVVSTPLKEPQQDPKTSMEKVQKPSSESTTQVPPLEDHDSIFIRILKPKAKETVQEPISPDPNSYQPKLPYPERMKSSRESRVLRKFLIPCDLQELDRTNALADSGASINLLPHSIYKQLGLGALKPTQMTLELANHSVTPPNSIARMLCIGVDWSDPLHHEFSGELLTLHSRNVREHEEYLSLMTLFCGISTSQSPKSIHANLSSIITSPIPVEDSDLIQEEIDIFLVPDDLIPPGVGDMMFTKDER